MNFIVGDSRAKILKDVMGNLVVEEVWARPGGKIVHMEKMVNDLTYLHHGESNEKSHFYIWVGICDITTRLRDYKSKYEEVIVDIEEIELKRARMLEDLRKLASTTINQYGKPIFCPIIPMTYQHGTTIGSPVIKPQSWNTRKITLTCRKFWKMRCQNLMKS